MNVFAVLIVGGSLIAMAGLPTMAGQPTQLLVNGPPLKVAENDDFASRKDAYLRKMRNEMAEWRNKLHAAGEGAEAKAHEASADTKAQLDRTWAETEGVWRNLEAESAEGWDKTKNAYERSITELRARWHKLHPEDKD